MILKTDPRISQAITATSSDTTSPEKAKTHEKLRQSTREFEAMYIYEAYKSMRKNVPDGGLIPKSSGEKMFQEMLDMEMAKTASSGEGMGLGKAMYNQLKNKIK